MKRILSDTASLIRRTALIENGRLVELLYDGGGESGSIVGNIYAGRVAAVKRGMQAAFVDIGADKNAYLYYGRERSVNDGAPAAFKEGDSVIVRVEKDASGAKGAVVTDHISLPGRFSVLLPGQSGVGVSKKITSPPERERIRALALGLLPEGFGLIVRTEGAGRAEAEFKTEITSLLSLCSKIMNDGRFAKPPALLYSDNSSPVAILRELMTSDVDALTLNTREDYDAALAAASAYPEFNGKIELYEGDIPLFEAFYVETQAEKALDKRVWLKSGGYIVIEQTEACVVIDVNTGKFTGRGNIEATFLKTNLEAADEIAAQLRLRNLSGIIIIDFIDMKNEADKLTLRRRLEAAAAQDRLKTVVVGMTELGLMQLTRKKARLPLSSGISVKCRCCGSGSLRSPRFIAAKMQREALSMLSRGGNMDISATADERLLRLFAGENNEFIKNAQSKYGVSVKMNPEPLPYGEYRLSFQNSPAAPGNA